MEIFETLIDLGAVSDSTKGGPGAMLELDYGIARPRFEAYIKRPGEL